LDIDANTLVILKLPGEIDLPIRTACRRYATTVHSASFEYELQPDPFSVARDALARFGHALIVKFRAAFFRLAVYFCRRKYYPR
jgi:hypothetical protein